MERTMARIARAASLALLIGLLAGVATSEAGTYCTSRGNATYCDDGTTYHQYGNYIQSNRGTSWRRFGSHAYGSDGSWYADHGDSVTSYGKRAPRASDSRVVPQRLFDGGWGDD